jgi:GMP synthase-like glutamine amidotransferase
MILLVSTCADKLSEEEFVRPVANIIRDVDVIHYKQVNVENIRKCIKVIICGTALKDNKYLDELHYFDWLKEFRKPVLGICAGMQILGLQFGCSLTKKKEIGLITLKTIKENSLFKGDFEAYCLHNNSLSGLNGFKILAKSGNSVQAIKHRTKPFYGVMFHPEVRNKDVINAFLEYF